MENNTLQQMKDALILKLKEIDPEVPVFGEEILESKGLEDISGNYFFLDIIPTGLQTVDSDYTDMAVLVDIAYHDISEKNAVYLIKQQQIDEKIRPVFSFGDRYITIYQSSVRVVDHVLHYTFNLSFRICRDKVNEFDYMTTLDSNVEIERT